MADTKQQKIIDEIVARMQTILTTNGYETNIGVNVEDSRTNWDEADDLPAISVFDGTTQAAEAPDTHSKTIHIMPVMIKCFLKAGATPAAEARSALRDIYAAINTDDRWTVNNVGLAMITREKSHAIERAENTYEITGAVVEIEVMYITQKFNLEN